MDVLQRIALQVINQWGNNTAVSAKRESKMDQNTIKHPCNNAKQ
jgi:hypothetical protein